MTVSIDLTKLRNNPISAFFNSVINKVGKYDPVALGIDHYFSIFTAKSAELFGLLNAPQGHVITAELESLDAKRDAAMSGISAIITGFKFSEDEVLKNHALVLSTHLSPFGNIVGDIYMAETNKIQRLISEWNAKPELAAAITALNLDSWKAKLEAHNEAFRLRYDDRSEDRSINQMDKVKAKRLETNQAYYDVRDALDGMYFMKLKAEPWATAVKALEGVIRDYNDTLNSRGPLGEEETPVENPAATIETLGTK